jgi:O-antigen/teichoic acid export membrane protein
MSIVETVSRIPTVHLAMRRWGGPVLLGICEQAIYSATNLVFTVMLLKMIGAREFGTYNIAWSVLMLAECLLYSPFGDALPAIANRLPKSQWPLLRASVYFWSATLSATVFAASLVLALVLAFVAPHYAVLAALTGLAIFTMRAQQMGRRICYLDGTRALAVAGACLSCVVTFGTLGLASWSGAQSSGIAMASLALGCAASASVLLLRRRDFQRPDRRFLLWSLRRFWHAGRPLTAASLSFWMANAGLIPVAGAALGREAAGLLRIVQTLTNPLTQLTAIMTSVALPPAAARLRTPTRQMFLRVSLKSVVLFAAIAAAYTLLLVVFGPVVVHLVFHGKLDGIGLGVLAVAALAASLDVIASALGVPLLATGRTVAILHGRIASLIALAVIMPFALQFPALGAFIAVTAASNFVQAAALAFSQSKQFQRLSPRDAT